jgi:cytochrome o ubiquinol oxidase subunit 2
MYINYDGVLMKKRKEKYNPGLTVLIIIFGLVDLAVLIGIFLRGKNIALFNPKGLIAYEQFSLLKITIGLLLAVAVPSVLLLYFIAWKYRESNPKATHEPDKKHGKMLNFGVWAVPSAVMITLTLIMIPATYRLVPQKIIDAEAEPLTIQVVSMRWKWLFIYPEQDIATVNYVNIPLNTPVQLELTADEAPMSSFWIPNLGGQLYTMTGHVNRLNLIADTIGEYPGSSAEINGAGFSGMKFIAHATFAEDFDSWVQQIKLSPEILDAAAYDKLLSPSENNPVAYYSSTDQRLFGNIITKYLGSHEHQTDSSESTEH